MKSIIFLLLLISSLRSSAQNLFLNPSIEDINGNCTPEYWEVVGKGEFMGEACRLNLPLAECGNNYVNVPFTKQYSGAGTVIYPTSPGKVYSIGFSYRYGGYNPINGNYCYNLVLGDLSGDYQLIPISLKNHPTWRDTILNFQSTGDFSRFGLYANFTGCNTPDVHSIYPMYFDCFTLTELPNKRAEILPRYQIYDLKGAKVSYPLSPGLYLAEYEDGSIKKIIILGL